MQPSGAFWGHAMPVKFIFLLSPNHSGTTIMGQYIAKNTGGFLPTQGNNEGQMMPVVRDLMLGKRWDPEKRFDWKEIRRLWTDAAAADGKDCFVECSPPNFLRVDDIRAEFGDDARYVSSISSPYAQIASVLMNTRDAPMSLGKIKNATTSWLFRAEYMSKLRQNHPDTPSISYESFCADPGVLSAALDLESKEASSFAGKKNDPVHTIVDMNPRHFAALTFAEWDQVNDLLAPHEELVNFLGYNIVPGQVLLAESMKAPALFHAGLLRRMRWENGTLNPAKKKSQKKAAGRLPDPVDPNRPGQGQEISAL